MGQAFGRKFCKREKVFDRSANGLKKSKRFFHRRRFQNLTEKQSDLSLHMVVLQNSAAGVMAHLQKSGTAPFAEKNCKGETALHLAFISNADDEIIDLLFDSTLHAGVINLADNQNLSYLHIACATARLHQARQLIEDGSADINCKVSIDADVDYAGRVPLHFAVECGCLQIVELLLSYGADIYASDVNGSTPLHLAVEHRDVEMIDLILKYDNRHENLINKFGVSHFMAACAGSNPTIVKQFLLTTGTSIPIAISSRVQTENLDLFYPNAGFAPLHFAAEFGRTETVRLLLDWGVECCYLGASESPYSLAFKNGHQEISRLIDKECAERQRLLQMLNDRRLDSGFAGSSFESLSNLSTEFDCNGSSVTRVTELEAKIYENVQYCEVARIVHSDMKNGVMVTSL